MSEPGARFGSSEVTPVRDNEEKDMRLLLATTALVMVMVGIGDAQTRSSDGVVAMWTCTLNDGKTQEHVQDANGKWVRLMNAEVAGGNIHSYVLTHRVGTPGTFFYIDTFPSLESWVGVQRVLDTEAGQAVDAELVEVAECGSHSLHRSTESH